MVSSSATTTCLSDSQLRRRKALADATAGVVATLISLWTFYPMDAWKTQLQAGVVDNNNNDNNTKSNKTLSWSALFRGLPVKTLHAASSSFLYFYLHSFLVSWWTKNQASGDKHRMSPVVRLSLSALAAMLNTMLTLPLDVLASQQQVAVALKLDSNNDKETYWDETQPESDSSSLYDDDEEEGPSIKMTNIIQQQPEHVVQVQALQMDQVWMELQQHASISKELHVVVDKVDGDVFYDSCSEAPLQPSCSRTSSLDDQEEEEEEKEEDDSDQPHCHVTVTVTATPTSCPFRSCDAKDKLCGVKTTTSSSYQQQHAKSPPRRVSSIMDTSSLQDVLALWKGLSPSLLLCSNPSIHYTVFDMAKSQLLQSRHLGSSSASSSSSSISMMEAFVLGLVAKFCATMATYPLIRAKVMLMVTSSRNGKHGLLQTLRRIYQQDGVTKGWYKGCSLQLLHTVLKSALLMMVKEYIAKATHGLLVPPSNTTTLSPPSRTTTNPTTLLSLR